MKSLSHLRIIEYVGRVGSFGLSLTEYSSHKIDQIISLIHIATVKNIELFVNVKFQTAARFIWGGGRLEKKLRYFVIVALAWVVFLGGGIFQSSLVKEDEKSDSLFLTSSGSILLGEVTAATYSGENSLSDEPIEHVVASGETLTSIGKYYGISMESVKYANNLATNVLKEGTVLIIPPVEGTLHTVKKGDTIASLAKKYNVPSQSIVDFNYLDAPYELLAGQIITIPKAQIPSTQKFYASSNSYEVGAYGVIPYAQNAVKGTGNFQWPLSGIISQGFHAYHPALDIAANSGNIVAADEGTVIRAGWWQGGYGNAVQLDHGNGFVTTYAHMSVISVSAGQSVSKGEKLGVVGSTGRSTGPHVHFTIQFNGKYLNPLSQL
ncbi:hypothetical protein CO178_01755 [candidate division WWE3 bacterium CG_4_9_14_3_um_filter_34_6]|uniref:LysM domain-containing protein n=1 Tax=candidate division WWE3 bacterium CG_4_9_14_3_um_filter_34_6 TaxID=1975079 RepID=A0A2M7X3D6_UNCKA|nr:MAG: hypothetical protein CO178_01755 [candidate division WWE3 bacterium CG_4_9_14_3_um_filter_34_6]